MVKKVRVILSLIVILCITFGCTIVAAEDSFLEVPQSKINIVPGTFEDIQQRDSFSLAGCTLEIGIASNGVEVSFVTSATQTANEIGVKDVVLQQKTWYGWKDIPISNHSTNNSDIYIGGVIYTSAEKGATYRAYCTHYAKLGGTESTLYNSTGNLVYN